MFARPARVCIAKIIEERKLHCAVALKGEGAMVAVAACAMTLSVLSNDGERSSWRMRLLLARGAGGRESWWSDRGRFRGLGKNAIIGGVIENKTHDCKGSSSMKDKG